jgi:hypothetical protein
MAYKLGRVNAIDISHFPCFFRSGWNTQGTMLDSLTFMLAYFCQHFFSHKIFFERKILICKVLYCLWITLWTDFHPADDFGVLGVFY